MPLNHLLGILIVIGIVLSWFGSEMSEEQLQHDQFCEMIEIYERSGGEYGWPDDGRECE